ncbi:MAG: fumarylacetoacetate hydrolase [Robiginitomaculum sp.]|nr:MAG: fumarylacetoacetate hydrolase [Robiginitomaculum sp.]
MKLATLIDVNKTDAQPDGTLVVVSHDGKRFISAGASQITLQSALEDWQLAEPVLRALAKALEDESFGQSLEGQTIAAPLPRAWQWLDGSAFASHGDLMDKVIGINPEKTDRPLMYQGVSDKFYGPTEDVVMASEELGIDFEGEFGIIVDAVPMGTCAEDAFKYIRLVVQINDWSLRALAGVEMKTGFGWVQAKPHCAMAPFAVTPDELGDAWKDGRVHLNLNVKRGEDLFGSPHGAPMGHGFHELVAHACATRNLVAGTVIGSGTVSNENFREIGSACIAERRGIEIVDEGAAKTPFMSFGENVRMEVVGENGEVIFGVLDQKVVCKN